MKVSGLKIKFFLVKEVCSAGNGSLPPIVAINKSLGPIHHPLSHLQPEAELSKSTILGSFSLTSLKRKYKRKKNLWWSEKSEK